MKNPNFGIGARNVAALARARQPQQAVQQRPVATQSGGGIGSLMRRANATMAGAPRSGAPRPGAPRSGTRMPDFSGFAAQMGRELRGGMPENRAVIGRHVMPSAGMKKGGKVKAKPVKKMAKGGSTASKRADGCATKGKTKGRFV